MSTQNPAQYSIPVEYLKQLTGLGLWYSRPMPCFGGGVWILKPVDAGAIAFLAIRLPVWRG